MKPLPQDKVSEDFTLAMRLFLSGTACLTAAIVGWDVPVIAGLGLGVGTGLVLVSWLGFWYVRGERRNKSPR